jgi:hypothetical protein
MQDDTQPSVAISPADRDIAIRTMIGEESTPHGQAGVASTMLNRATSGKYGGKSLSDVAFAPGQFEPWSSRAADLLKISPDDPKYQRAGAILDGVSSGEIPDFTGGSTHFYSPGSQAALGRNAPNWASGQGTPLGKTMFYAPEGPVSYKPAAKAIAAATTAPVADPYAGLIAQYTQPTAQADPYADLIKQYTGAPEASGAGPSAAPTAAAASAAVDPYGDLIRQYTGTPDAAPAAPTAPATPIGVNDSVRAIARGVPIIGGALNKIDAATNAALAPIANRFFDPQDQLKGETFGERYANSLEQQNQGDKAFGEQHQIADNVLGAVGAVGGTVPMMMAAPGAFGVGSGNLLARSVASAASGGVIGGADAGVRSGGDLDAVKSGAEVGLAFGGIAPAIGSAVGAGINKLTNFATRTTPAARNVAGVLSDIGMTPQQADNALSRIGPQAVLADIDPALTTEAGGLASLGGAPTSVLKKAMAARGAGADNRVAQAVDQSLGPKPDLTAAVEAIEKDAATRAGPHYNAGRNGAPMDVTGVLADIDSRLPNATGGAESVLNKIKGFLTDKVASGANPTGLDVPKSDPGAIHAARQALDDMIEKMPLDTSAGKNAYRVANDLRNKLDTVVKGNPDFAAGDAIYAQSMGIRDAMQEGVDAFKKAVRPEDMARTIASMSPEQAAAYRQGARVTIGDTMEGAQRGEHAGAQSMFGRGSANRAKLDTLFPKAGDVFDMLHGEASMRTTEQRVALNSATAERQAVQQKYSPSSEQGMSAAVPVLGQAMGGGYGAAAATGGRMLYGALHDAFTTAARNKLTEGTARGLAASGPEQRAFMAQIGRAANSQRVSNALTGGVSSAANALTRSGAQEYNNQVIPTLTVNRLSGAQ